MPYKQQDYFDVVLMVIGTIAALTGLILLFDNVFAEKVLHNEVVQYKGYDESRRMFFVITGKEEGETRFDVKLSMYEKLEVGQTVLVSYRLGRLTKYYRKIMEIN